MEASKKKGLFGKSYALMLTVALDANTTLPAEFRHIKAAVMEWIAHRGKNCARIQITVVLTPNEVSASRAFVEQVYQEEGDLAPVFKSLDFSVCFIDANEHLLDEFSPGISRASD